MTENISDIINTLTHLRENGVSDTLKLLGMYFGGSVFYGGFIGGTLALLIYTRISKSVGRAYALDIWAVSVPLFHAFGRIGCFLGGCCYGIESQIGFIINGNTLVPEINGVRRFPVALTESACCLVIFLILLYVENKCCMCGKKIYLYMILYSPVRFVLEFFRGDDIRGFLFGLSTSQWISIILFVFGIFMLLSRKYKGKEKPPKNT